jgi:hypothetical protein
MWRADEKKNQTRELGISFGGHAVGKLTYETLGDTVDSGVAKYTYTYI